MAEGWVDQVEGDSLSGFFLRNKNTVSINSRYLVR